MASVPSFRKPWEHGAKAYHEADSLAAIVEHGMKRRRVPYTVLILHKSHGVDGVPCAACGEDLAGPYGDGDHVDNYAMVDVNPRSRTMSARHYYCAWGATMSEVAKIRRAS